MFRYLWLRAENERLMSRPASPHPARAQGSPEALTRRLKGFLAESGADLAGVCALREEFFFAGERVPAHPRLVCYAAAMDFEAMKRVGPRAQIEVHRAYWRLSDIGLRLVQWIRSHGYEARGYANRDALAFIPAARAAGLGVLGKHGSLITREFGSCVRLGAVSTGMPLLPDRPGRAPEDACLRCRVCERYCPGEAIRHEKQEASGTIRWRVDIPACLPHFLDLNGCKICLMVCAANDRGAFKTGYRRAMAALASDRRPIGEIARGWKEAEEEARGGELDACFARPEEYRRQALEWALQSDALGRRGRARDRLR